MPYSTAKIFRQVHPSSLHANQYAQAEAIQARCFDFHEDYRTLKWEFAPNKRYSNAQYFDAITGKDDYKLAVLRDEINYLVETTKATLGRRNNASHTEVLMELRGRLNWFVHRSRELKVRLEGDGHTYRAGTPHYKVLGTTNTNRQYPPSRSPNKHTPVDFGSFDGPLDASSPPPRRAPTAIMVVNQHLTYNNCFASNNNPIYNNFLSYNKNPSYNHAPSYDNDPSNDFSIYNNLPPAEMFPIPPNNANSSGALEINSPSRDREIQPGDEDMGGMTIHLEEDVTYNFSSLEEDSEPLFVMSEKTSKTKPNTKPKVTMAQRRVRKHKPKGPRAADFTFSDLEDEADEPVLIRPRRDPTKKDRKLPSKRTPYIPPRPDADGIRRDRRGRVLPPENPGKFRYSGPIPVGTTISPTGKQWAQAYNRIDSRWYKEALREGFSKEYASATSKLHRKSGRTRELAIEDLKKLSLLD